jgi:hypothetical protein
MGVPKLWAFVAQQKFAETLSLPVSGDNIGDSGVVHFIFDAPSFAYWYWREASMRQGLATCLSMTHGKRTIFGIQRLLLSSWRTCWR